MKTLLVLLSLTFSVAAFAQIEDGSSIAPNEGSDGCGLGWQVTQDRTLLATSTRGTVNIFVPPSFGMSSGTLGCEKHGFAQKEIGSAAYAHTNYEPLVTELARGQGKYLEGFAFTLGCHDVGSWANSMRAHYSEIVPKTATGVDLYKNIRQVIRTEKSLAANCPNAA